MAPKWVARLFGRIQTEVDLAFKFRSEPLGVKVLADTQTSHDEAVSAVLLSRPTRIVRVSVLDYRFAKWGTIDVRNREVYLGEGMLVGSVGGTGRLGCVLAVAEFCMSKEPYPARSSFARLAREAVEESTIPDISGSLPWVLANFRLDIGKLPFIGK